MGESLLGIEVPNHTASLVALKNVMESTPYISLAKKSQLPVALGKGSDGEEVSFDLSKMPHLLIAGATGSGKSVCINAIITGLIMEKDPSEPLPMSPSASRTEAECYAMGCADVMVVVSKSLTSDDWDSVRRDFIITTDRD